MLKTFQYQNSAISYNVYGSGTSVVLLHGFAEDSTIWNSQVDALSNVCQLIIPDLPGSEKSEILRDENAGMEAYADCIHALLLHEKIETCIMLGHSMGGYITLAFAERYANKLKGFGFVHSTAFEDSDERKVNRKKGIKLMDEYGAVSFVKNTTPNLFTDAFKKEHADKVDEIIHRITNANTPALTQYYRAMLNRPDRKHVLEFTEVPVLFIAGKEDITIPVNDVLQQVRLPRVSYIHIINNAGHMSMIETPDELNKHLLYFIRLCEPV